MFFDRQMKKCAAFIAALAVVLTLIPADLSVAYADGEDNPAIYVDYLGMAVRSDNPDRGPSSTKWESRPAFTELQKGSIFWVGVRVTNLNMVSFIQSGGIQELEITFDYNSDYIAPADDLALTLSGDDLRQYSPDRTKWIEQIKDFNFTEEGSTEEYTGNALWDSRYYSIGAGTVPNAEPDQSPGREPTSTPMTSNSWKSAHMFIQKINELENSNTTRFYNIGTGAEQYLIRIPFILKDAPTDGTKPETLFLSRGPASLQISTDTDDGMPYQWENEDRRPDVNPIRNLKRYFTFGGDLNLFQETDGITSLQFTYTTGEGEEATENNIDLYENYEQNGNSVVYNPETLLYYISVPKDIEKINFMIKGTEEKPQVKHGDYSSPSALQDVAGVTKTDDSWTGSVTLSGIVAASGQENTPDIVGVPNDASYKNVVTITVGTKTYTVHVREAKSEPAGEARIELAPGNSPYGLIERMGEKWYTGEGTAWTEEEIAAAKKVFDSVNKFTSGYTPDKGNTAALYTVEAWVGDGEDVSSEDIKNPEINMDRNVNTQFYYNKSEYQEMGFTAYNSDGTTVAAIDVTVTIGLDKMAADNINNFKDDAVEHDDAVNVADLGEEISARPGIYTLTYSFEDKISKETITNTRKFVVVWENGDADLSGYLNSGDADTVYDVLARRLVPYNGVIDSSANVHKYRMLDVDNSQYVNSGDADMVYDALARRSTLVVYYSNI